MLHQLLVDSVAQKASDLHLSANTVPWLRRHGKLCPLDHPVLNSSELEAQLLQLLTAPQKELLQTRQEIDFAYTLENGTRFRAHIFFQRTGIAAAFRIIHSHIPTLESLKLPLIFQQFSQYTHGLILVTGATGSGKSTTLAALIDEINKTREAHIITIEDPIEFLHTSQKSLVHQREVGHDTLNFKNALRAALREDPDVILVGELRDLETIQLAITAAETGHLVLGTLHTRSATKALHRLVDVFPGDEKNAVRMLLSESLQAVIAQELIPGPEQKLQLLQEIMITTPAIRNLIREDKIAQLPSCIQTSNGLGMQTFEQHAKRLGIGG